MMGNRGFTVEELLVGSLAMGSTLYHRRCRAGDGGRALRRAAYARAVFAMLLYAFAIRGYTQDVGSDMAGRTAVGLAFMGVSLLYLFSSDIRIWLAGRRDGVLFCALAALTPAWGFWTIESAFNQDMAKMEWKYVAGNIVWLAVLFALLCCAMPKKKLAAGMFLTMAFAFGVANHYVGRFRGSPVMPGDLMAAGTAFQVAGGYEFEVSEEIAAAVALWYAGIAAWSCLPEEKRPAGWWKRAAAWMMAIGVSALCLCPADMEAEYGITFNYWDVGASYREMGSVLGFALLAQKVSMDEPDGYSRQRVEEIFRGQEAKGSLESVGPTIIAIMDESFSDLRVLGNFACSEECLENWYAVDDYLYKGNLYVPTFGGGTANTEFEFLTGNSMANCLGAIPYQACNLKNVGNLADILTHAGYETIAVHPENKGNWNRARVYSNFGFQLFLGMDDFVEPLYIQGRISDHSSFQKIIELYEGRGGKQFLFNVTMQNHGGYDIHNLAGYETVRLGEGQGTYTDVEAYLTLMRESDRAIHGLLEYFRGVEDPVVICIFGDHLPAVDVEWMEGVMGKPTDSLSLEEAERKYAVPYMIWANYDTAYGRCDMDTSANYLGALLLQAAGLPGTAYTDYLLTMREHIPALNAFGYRTADGCWHSFYEETEVSGWVDDYRMLQYNAMFDRKRDMGNYR